MKRITKTDFCSRCSGYSMIMDEENDDLVSCPECSGSGISQAMEQLLPLSDRVQIHIATLEMVHVSDLVKEFGEEVSSVLLELELAGIIKQYPEKYFGIRYF